MPNGYKGALDRFSQFFKTPLFKESAVEREIKAVDSEHAKNLQDDTWRMMQLERSLTRAGHPYKKFGTGKRCEYCTRGRGLTGFRQARLKLFGLYQGAKASTSVANC